MQEKWLPLSLTILTPKHLKMSWKQWCSLSTQLSQCFFLMKSWLMTCEITSTALKWSRFSIIGHSMGESNHRAEPNLSNVPFLLYWTFIYVSGGNIAGMVRSLLYFCLSLAKIQLLCIIIIRMVWFFLFFYSSVQCTLRWWMLLYWWTPMDFYLQTR